MTWYSPPNRRETSLILFSLTVFVLFYNLENSFTRHELDTNELTAIQGNGGYLKQGNGKDKWDEEIYGDWTWEEEQVAKNAQKLAASGNGDMMTPAIGAPVSFRPDMFGIVGVNDGFLEWGHEIPTTSLLKHVPGYTIMDNVFILNGTVYIVSDDTSFPSLSSIASSGENSHAVPQPSEWQILSSNQATGVLGERGGLIQGVNWLVTDASPSNYTLFSLWRIYSALNTSMSASDTLTLPPPRRVFYVNVPTFMGEQPDLNGPIVVRQRSPSGFHPFLPKAAFPTLGLMYKEDWQDYALLHVPFLIRRVVIADQGAARRSGDDVPPFGVPFVRLEVSKEWWEPIRRNLASFLDIPEQGPKKENQARTVITYLSRQDAVGGQKLRRSDHDALVNALEKLGSEYTVHVIPSEASWTRRMTAIAQSTIVISVYGDHLADCLFMVPSARSAVMEIFPPGIFIRDAEISVNSLGIKYFAWWQAQQHGVDKLPSVVLPGKPANEDIPVDASAIVQAIKRIA